MYNKKRELPMKLAGEFANILLLSLAAFFIEGEPCGLNRCNPCRDNLPLSTFSLCSGALNFLLLEDYYFVASAALASAFSLA